jgi:signal transduction histidine kinase
VVTVSDLGSAASVAQPAPARRRPSLRRISGGLALVVLAASAAVAWFAVRAYRAAEEVQHARRVHLLPAIDAVNSIRRAAVDQESGLRGFLLTADAGFLRPYESGLVAEGVALTQLEVSLADSYPELYALVAPAETALRSWRDEIAIPEIELVRDGRRASAIAKVQTGEGMRLFDEVRETVEHVANAIEAEREESRAALVDRIDRLFTVSIGGALVAAGAAVAMWTISRRNVAGPLGRLSGAATAVAEGRLDTRIPVGGPREIVEVARAVEQMRVQLLGELRQAFSSGMVEAEEAERSRLAGELHDDPIQVLTSAQWQLEALLPGLDGATAERAGAVAASLNEVQARLRTLMFRLHPPGLDDEGLQIALDDLLADTFEGTEVQIGLEVDLPADFDDQVTTLLFRIAAEAIRNVRKHAAASTVHVSVRSTGDGVQCRVVDDGVGSGDESLPSGPHGISISRALAGAAGGWWHRAGRPGRGTVVTCWLPLSRPAEAALEVGDDGVGDARDDGVSRLR